MRRSPPPESYLAEFEAEYGPIPEQERQEAAEWADRVLPGPANGNAER